jgi:ribonuclease HII
MITVGIDEVGRGCWAGPVVAGAVILNAPIVGLKDSKLLSKKQREAFDVEIRANTHAIGLGWVEAEVIDQIGINAAVKLAMHKAMQQIQVVYDEIIVDGNINYFSENPKAHELIKADSLVPAVSAASIVAKVARDNFMAKVDLQDPGYGFAEHVGYGTAQHIKALKLKGLTIWHRKSYKPIKALIQ